MISNICFRLAWLVVDSGVRCLERSVLLDLVPLLMHYNEYMIVSYVSVGGVGCQCKDTHLI
jgi:hypothetical protein